MSVFYAWKYIDFYEYKKNGKFKPSYYVFFTFYSLPLLLIIVVYGAAFHKLLRSGDSSVFPISNKQVLLQLSSFTIYVVA